MEDRGFIDLHCHLLPGVDDGALDVEDSVLMARRGVEEGFTAICATPHIRHDHDVRIGEIAGRVAALGEEFERRGVALRVLTGGEVAETFARRLRDEDLERVSLGGGGWILLEPRPGPLSDSLPATVEHLGERGFRVLVAHPERHLGEDWDRRLQELVAMGARVQATAWFFAWERTRDGMRDLAARGLVHVLSSDAHSSHGGRAVALRDGLDALAGIGRVAAHRDWIAFDAPRAIVAGEALDPPYPAG